MSHVGIFWFVPANLGGWSALVADMAPIEEMPEHGGIKRYAGSHAAYWRRMGKLGERKLRSKGLPPIIATADYRTFPRGRVDFEVGGRRFIVRLDARLNAPAYIASVVAQFDALPGHVTVFEEPLYTSA